MNYKMQRKVQTVGVNCGSVLKLDAGLLNYGLQGKRDESRDEPMKRDLKRTKPAIHRDRYVLCCLFYYIAHISV